MTTLIAIRRTITRRSGARFGPGFWASVVVSSALVGMAVFAPLIAPYNPEASNVLEIYLPASPEHWLGTDGAGRDLFSRLVFGARTALLGPLVVVLVATVLGTTLGLLAAWNKGWVDSVVGRMFDLIFSFPSMLLALVLVAVIAPGLPSAALAVSIAFVPAIGRLVRSTALREVSEPYIEALYTQGQSSMRIAGLHILPNLWPVVVAQMTTAFGFAMVELAGISYLGLGVQEPTPDWGLMIEAGQSSIVRGYPQESLWAGAMLVIAVISFMTLGDAMSKQKVES